MQPQQRIDVESEFHSLHPVDNPSWQKPNDSDYNIRVSQRIDGGEKGLPQSVKAAATILTLNIPRKQRSGIDQNHHEKEPIALPKPANLLKIVYVSSMEDWRFAADISISFRSACVTRRSAWKDSCLCKWVSKLRICTACSASALNSNFRKDRSNNCIRC